jgi:hypothetical protein
VATAAQELVQLLEGIAYDARKQRTGASMCGLSR